MSKKSTIVLLAAVILTVIQICLRIFTSPTEAVIEAVGNIPSDMFVYYKTKERHTYHEKQVIPCSTDFKRRYFSLPENALMDSLRFDFGVKESMFRINSLTLRRNYFFMYTFTPEELYEYYIPNSMVSWDLNRENGILTVRTKDFDPYIIPKNEKLPFVPLSGLSYTAVFNQLAFFLLYLLIGTSILYWKKWETFYQDHIRKYRWYLALAVFFGCFAFLFTNTTSWILNEKYGRYAGVLLIVFAILHFVEIRINKKENEKEKALAQPDALPKKKRQMDMAMVYFRAFAILSIVIGHYLDVGGWFFVKQDTAWIVKLSHVIFSNATIYFLFISGYLFYYLTDRFSGHWEKWKFVKDQGKFNLPVFYRKKITNVLFPYLVISVLIGFFITATHDYSGFVGNQFSWGTVPSRLVKGTMQMQYWYIPFILIVFLFAPLLLVLPQKIFFGLLIPTAICSLTVPRPKEMLQLNGFLFFLFSFLAGIWYAMDKEKLLKIFKTYFWFFLTAAVLCSYFCFYFSRYSHEHFCTTTTLHKWCMIPVVIVILEKIKDKKVPILINIANLSFTLYFLHMMIVQKVFYKTSLALVSGNIILPIEICLIRVALASVFLYLLSWSLKVLTGRFSRSLIGS